MAEAATSQEQGALVSAETGGEPHVESSSVGAVVAASKPTGRSRRVRGHSRHECTRLSKAIVGRQWRHVEDFADWSAWATKTLAQLLEPLPNEVEELDISCEGARVETVEEEIEAMIRRRLLAEGFDEIDLVEDQGDAEGSDHDSVSEGGADVRRPPAKRCRTNCPERREVVAGGDAEELERHAPIRNEKELKDDRNALIRTASGDLAKAALATMKKHPRKMFTFVYANKYQGSKFYVYANAIEGSPHKQWIERIARRYTASPVVARRAVVHECAPSDLSRIPADLPRVAEGEVILTVIVCNTLGHKEQEFDVLASQRLYELRDAFHFASDWMFDGPTRMKSACFFIDGAFYVDKRDPTAIDYSVELIDWLKATREPGFLKSEAASRSMDVRISDLGQIPFGTRCAYIHQGDVEHSIYFANARLVNTNCDCPFLEAYPVLTYMRKYKKRLCFACWHNAAVWIVIGSSRCPHNPSFWCGQCFRQFFQDKDGVHVQPVDYKVFPYLHDDF